MIKSPDKTAKCLHKVARGGKSGKIYSHQNTSLTHKISFLTWPSPLASSSRRFNHLFEWWWRARRHMAAVELPVSSRFLCLGRITSCWVPLRGDTFKAAALSAAGATSGDRLHTLPQALHFSLSLSFWCLN